MAMNRDEIFQEVLEVLVDALGVDNDEVTTEATLMGDLGAESIDFLDIVFRLEKAFGIKIPREELFPAESLMNNPELVWACHTSRRGPSSRFAEWVILKIAEVRMMGSMLSGLKACR